MLSLVLMHKPLRHPGMPKGLAHQLASPSLTNIPEASDVGSITLALRTLGSFEFEGKSFEKVAAFKRTLGSKQDCILVICYSLWKYLKKTRTVLYILWTCVLILLTIMGHVVLVAFQLHQIYWTRLFYKSCNSPIFLTFSFCSQDTLSLSLCATVLITSWTVNTRRSGWRRLGPAHAFWPPPSTWSVAKSSARQLCRWLQMCSASYLSLESLTQVRHERITMVLFFNVDNNNILWLRKSRTQNNKNQNLIIWKFALVPWESVNSCNGPRCCPCSRQIPISDTACWPPLMSVLTPTSPRLKICRLCLSHWTMRCLRSGSSPSAQLDASAAWTPPLLCPSFARCSSR